MTLTCMRRNSKITHPGCLIFVLAILFSLLKYVLRKRVVNNIKEFFNV